MARNPATRAGTRTAAGGVERRSGVRFFGEVVSELRKVHWPTRQETTRLTIMVLIIATVIGAILGLIDMGFSRMFSWISGT